MHVGVKIGPELPLPNKRCPEHKVRYIENCPICHPPAKVVCEGCGEVMGVPCTNERGEGIQDPHYYCQERRADEQGHWVASTALDEDVMRDSKEIK